MPSPFPGMDPFLESHWGDVHTSLTTYARDQLRLQLPRDLRVRVEEFLHVDHELPERSRSVAPDVRVYEKPSVAGLKRRRKAARGSLAVAEPLVIRLDEPWTERTVQITDRTGDRLVTSLEFLSPGNKRTADQRLEFHTKQDELLTGGVNLVEIDLLRQGGWTVSAPEESVPESHTYPYRICVVRAEDPTAFECYAAPLQQRLPTIRIPLRDEDDDVTLDLQALLDAAWENGDYVDIDYARAWVPRFLSADEEWIRNRLSAAGFPRSNAGS
jgi:hypothetical protein